MASPEEAPTVTQTVPGSRAGAGWIRPVLAGLGAFLLVFGLLLRLYVAPRLIAAPAGFYIVVTLAAPHASYFDERALTTRRDVTLTYNDTIRGDAGASTGTIAVWDQFTVLADRKRNVQLIATSQRSAFNRRTGELSNCCGASVNDDTQVRQDGIGVVFWPIGTRQTTYQVYDTNTERAWPAAYSGTAYVQGLLTYRFTQRIPVTVVQQLPGVPTSLLGLRGPSRNVVANRTFQATNTFWVDPRTGVPVNVQERILSVLHAHGGQGRLMVSNADLTMTSASQRALAAVARQNAAAITTVRQEGPLAGRPHGGECAAMTGFAVLVVDDEPGMRDTLTAILELHGYCVSSASDGETAVAAVREGAFDVVVMDIRMPGRDGVSVLEEMGDPPPQVILMTAYAQEERLRAAVKANAFAIVHKPFDTRRMLSLVADASRAVENLPQVTT